jgi:hypothetical protein
MNEAAEQKVAEIMGIKEDDEIFFKSMLEKIENNTKVSYSILTCQGTKTVED